MKKISFLLSLAIINLVGLSACSSPPKASCIAGIYLLDLDDRIRLGLHADRYTLRVGTDTASGSYHYNASDSTISFQPSVGSISTSAMREIHKTVGANSNLDAFLAAMGGHTINAYDISQDAAGAIYIAVDPDGINFVKKSCE